MLSTTSQSRPVPFATHAPSSGRRASGSSSSSCEALSCALHGGRPRARLGAQRGEAHLPLRGDAPELAEAALQREVLARALRAPRRRRADEDDEVPVRRVRHREAEGREGRGVAAAARVRARHAAHARHVERVREVRGALAQQLRRAVAVEPVGVAALGVGRAARELAGALVLHEVLEEHVPSLARHAAEPVARGVAQAREGQAAHAAGARVVVDLAVAARLVQARRLVRGVLVRARRHSLFFVCEWLPR